MTASTLTGYIYEPDGTPATRGIVRAQLVPALGYDRSDFSGTVSGQTVSSVQTNIDAHGAWAMDLQGNSDISPAGTYWRIIQSGGGLSAPPIYVTMPNDGGIYHVIDVEAGLPVNLGGINGISVAGYEYGSGAPFSGAPRSGWKAPDLDPFTDLPAWGFPVVRMPLAWANLEPAAPVAGVHTWNSAYLSSIDDTVSRFASAGINIIYSFHQNDWTPAITIGSGPGSYPGGGLPTWLYPGVDPSTPACTLKKDWFLNRNGWDGATAAHSFLADHFASAPNVIGCDLFNEPYGCVGLPGSSMQLQAMYEMFGTAVAAANPDLLLVVQDAHTLGSAGWGLGAKPNLPNLVYSAHIYTPDWVPDGLSVATPYLARAAAWNIPLWIGEFDGFGTAGCSDADLTSDQAAEMAVFLDWCTAHSVSWSFWGWTSTCGLMHLDGTPKSLLLETLQGGL